MFGGGGGVYETHYPALLYILKTLQNQNHIYYSLGVAPCPKKKNRLITFLVGDSYTPPFATLSRREPHPKYIHFGVGNSPIHSESKVDHNHHTKSIGRNIYMATLRSPAKSYTFSGLDVKSH